MATTMRERQVQADSQRIEERGRRVTARAAMYLYRLRPARVVAMLRATGHGYCDVNRGRPCDCGHDDLLAVFGEMAEQFRQPMSVSESEAKRNEQTGAAEPLLAGATDSGRASSASDSPALVRVPEAVSDTQFPCFVDAADGSPTDQGHGIRVNDAEIQDGYLATRPIPLGGAKAVSYLVYDEKGVIAITSSPRKEGDTADDIRRADQKRLYAKREQTLRDWGYLPGIDTEQLKRNGDDQ